MSNSVLGFLGALSLCATPRVAGEITLIGALDCEGARFHILGDHRPRPGDRIVTDRQWR